MNAFSHHLHSRALRPRYRDHLRDVQGRLRLQERVQRVSRNHQMFRGPVLIEHWGQLELQETDQEQQELQG
jgi:hypothetical protein